MSEMYSRLFELPKNMYVTGSPVLISAGALLLKKDTEEVLAQLKIKNIQPKELKAVTVNLHGFDISGENCLEKQTFQYLDLTAKRNQEFGVKVPIKFSKNTVRSYKVVVKEAIFSDHSIWKGNYFFAPLSEQKIIDEAFQDKELCKQYRINYGDNAKYVLQEVRDLWFCACGEVNRKDENLCHSCQLEASKLKSLDMDSFKSAAERRVKREVALAEEAQWQHEKKEQKQERERKVVLCTFAVISCLFILGLLYKNVYLPSAKYNEALSLIEENQYDLAAIIFDELGDYKDSTALELECRYTSATLLLEQGEYQKAANRFSQLEDYNDSVTMVLECGYQSAVILFNRGEYTNAKKEFSALEDYRDSATMTQESDYQLAMSYFAEKSYSDAKRIFDLYVTHNGTSDYKDCDLKSLECDYLPIYETGLLDNDLYIYEYSETLTEKEKKQIGLYLHETNQLLENFSKTTPGTNNWVSALNEIIGTTNKIYDIDLEAHRLKYEMIKSVFPGDLRFILNTGITNENSTSYQTRNFSSSDFTSLFKQNVSIRCPQIIYLHYYQEGGFPTALKITLKTPTGNSYKDITVTPNSVNYIQFLQVKDPGTGTLLVEDDITGEIYINHEFTIAPYT